MAALLVLLLLLAVPPTAFTTITDVYYVTAHDAAGHEQSCPPHQQICHRNLSYYISHSDSYFTSDTTIIFLEGEHSFDREDLVHVINVHNLTLKGQGQWPVAGAEETVMQSVVIINCTRGRGGFYFGTSHDITVEGLTVVNCGGLDSAVFSFSTVQSLFFHKNSIQLMTGYGLHVHNCNNVIITNCSYYHSSVFNISNSSQLYGGGVGIVYDTQYSNTGYTLELSHSNMTKCCSIGSGGGVYLEVLQLGFHGKLLFNHLKFSKNEAVYGGGIGALLRGSGNVTLTVSSCDLFNGTALKSGGGLNIEVNMMQSANILLNDLIFSYNKADYGGGIAAFVRGSGNVALNVSNSDFFNGTALHGGGMYIEVNMMQSTNIPLNHSELSHNKADDGAGISAWFLSNDGIATLNISNCVISNGTAVQSGGGLRIVTNQRLNITIDNTDFVDNNGQSVGEIEVSIQTGAKLYKNTFQTAVYFSMLNSTVQHTNGHSDVGVLIVGYSAIVQITNTSMRFANVGSTGFLHDSSYSSISAIENKIHMDSCQFIGSTGVPSIVYLNLINAVITNCIFYNNTSDAYGRSVITLHQTGFKDVIHSCTISDNNMTGITLIETSATFSGHNVIKNNRNTEGAGIKLLLRAYIQIDGELLLYNNTADKHGGAILVIASQQRTLQSIFRYPCSLMSNGNSSSVIFSGNRAGRGGSDMYGAILMGCNTSDSHVPHVGKHNETSWYFDTPLMKYLHFSNTDRLSSMSSDPIMICFCNTTTNLPDCSDRTHHMQTYPGLEINTSIATVGYYGGTSPGVVLVSAQHATLVRYYGQNETTNCFQLHILLPHSLQNHTE